MFYNNAQRNNMCTKKGGLEREEYLMLNIKKTACWTFIQLIVKFYCTATVL
jgi:hypothetical protein